MALALQLVEALADDWDPKESPQIWFGQGVQQELD